MSKGDPFFLIIMTVFILLPIAGSIISLVKIFMKVKLSDKKNTSKQTFLFIGIVYGVMVESFLIWLSWISKFDVPPFAKFIGFFGCLPYFMVLLIVTYALGPAVTFGGGSANKIFNHITEKDRK